METLLKSLYMKDGYGSKENRYAPLIKRITKKLKYMSGNCQIENRERQKKVNKRYYKV